MGLKINLFRMFNEIDYKLYTIHIGMNILSCRPKI